MIDNYSGLGETGYEGRKLNHDVDLIFDTAEYPDEYYAEVMDTMYIPIRRIVQRTTYLGCYRNLNSNTLTWISKKRLKIEA